MSDGFNANPTIRNASDLPSRQRHTANHLPSTKAPRGLLTSTIPSSAYIPDPFSSSPSLSDDDDSDNDDDETADSVEPIDEQEIYGVYLLTSFVRKSRDYAEVVADLLFPYRPHFPYRGP